MYLSLVSFMRKWMPFQAPLCLLWQSILLLAKRNMESREMSQQNGVSVEIGEVATVDCAAGDEKEVRDPGQEFRGVDLPVLFPNRFGKFFGSDGQRIVKSTHRPLA